MKTVDFVIGITTAPGYVEKQRAVRNTWLRDVAGRPNVDAFFLMGKAGIKLPERVDDVLYLPIVDKYETLPQKTRWFASYCLANYNFGYAVKVDDDTHVRIDRLLNAGWSAPVVGSDHGDHYHGGAGYGMTRAAAYAVAELCTAKEGLEDWKSRDAIRAAGMDFVHDARLCPWNSTTPTPDNGQITTHYISPLWHRVIDSRFRKWEGQTPKILWQTWCGDKEIPQAQAKYCRQWEALCKSHGWTYRLVTDADAPAEMPNLADLCGKVAKPAQRSHLLRFELLNKYGGVYVDTDVEPLKSATKLFARLSEDGCGSAFCAAEDDGTAGVAVLGCNPGDPLIRAAVEGLPASLAKGGDAPTVSGSHYFTKLLHASPDWRVYGWENFYPVHWSGRQQGDKATAFAAHHWAASWKGCKGC
jgi:hypothetical protein